MTNQISMKECRRRLATLWFAVGLTLFVVLVLQSVLDRFGDRVEDAWSWFLPSVMPTLLLIVGVLVLDVASGGYVDRNVDPFFFWLTFSLSALYLLLVAATLLLQPFTGVPVLDLMKQSSLWLGPLQGLVAQP